MRVLQRIGIITVAISFLFATALDVTASEGSNVHAGLITHNSSKDSGDEVLLIRYSYKGTSEQFRKDMYTNSDPNTVRKIKTVPAKGITSLTVSANYFGVVVEPIAGNEYIINLNGVKNSTQVTVDTDISYSNLTVKVKGNRNDNMLISTVSGNRINTVYIGVPVGTLQGLMIQDDGNSCILINNMAIPVQADIGSGTARVQGETLAAAVSMNCSNGDVIVRAKQVEGPVHLTTTNGDVVLNADTVSGKAELTASSGDVTVQAGTIHNAVFKASSGDIHAEIAQIVGSVKATVSSGDLALTLTKRPANLRFVFDGNANSEDVSLPKGWRDGYTVGNGMPLLHLGVGSGDLELKVD